jgi:hypothetical protein
MWYPSVQSGLTLLPSRLDLVSHTEQIRLLWLLPSVANYSAAPEAGLAVHPCCILRCILCNCSFMILSTRQNLEFILSLVFPNQ